MDDPSREQLQEQRAELRRRLNLGERDERAWLTTGEAATVLGSNRTAVHRMLAADPPLLRWKYRSGAGRHRLVHPADVLVELHRIEQVHGAGGPPADQ